MAAMDSLLIAGLVQALPEPGAVFTPARRDKWLIVAENVFELVYLKAGAPPEQVDGVDTVDGVDKVEAEPGVLLADMPAPEVEVVQARPVLRLGRPLEKNKGVKGKKETGRKKGLVPVSRPAVAASPGKPGRARGAIYDAVRVVLLEKGEPMTIREITLAIEKRYKELASGYTNLKQSLHAVCRNMEDSDDLESDVREGLTVWAVVGS